MLKGIKEILPLDQDVVSGLAMPRRVIAFGEAASDAVEEAADKIPVVGDASPLLGPTHDKGMNADLIAVPAVVDKNVLPGMHVHMPIFLKADLGKLGIGSVNLFHSVSLGYRRPRALEVSLLF